MDLLRPVRVRVAPSPTGDAHVGTARTTLYDYLLTKQHQGTFVLRIDDTDSKRNSADAEEGVYRSLQWLGLQWDEGPDKGGPDGPYRQSERLNIYHRYVEQLLAEGKAYECYCTSEELDAERSAQQAAKQDIRYSGKCRCLTPGERERLRAEGRTPTVRLAVPDAMVGFQDLVHGWIEADGALIGDLIILKSNGIPVYNFATAIDDHLMKISLVTRAAEHIANTFPQIFIYRALGWEIPQFAHFSTMLNEDRTKISKRKGATFIGQYADMGYLPEAMLNFLAFLGWSPGAGEDDEIMTLQEMIHKFSLPQCTVSNAIFDIKKLDWMNAKWIRRLDRADLAARLIPFLEKAGLMQEPTDLAYVIKAVPLVQERLHKLADIRDFSYLFLDPEVPWAEIEKVLVGKDLRVGLKSITEALSISPWDANSLEQAIHQVQDRLGWTTKEMMMTIRVALSGGRVSPPLFATMELLGKERTLRRLERVTTVAMRPI